MKRFALSAAMLVILGVLTIPVTAAGSPLASSTLSRVWVEPAAGYRFLTTALASARRDIDLSMYELKDPNIESLLVREARAGVRVRVALNADYYGRSENAAAASVLSHGGVHVVWAPRGQIFHAKYLVIDDARAYVGTGNLVDYYYSSTRDFWVLDQGATDVAAIVATFSDDFAGSSRAPVTRGGLV